MKGAWPVSAKGSAARCYRGDYIDQNFDTYSVEYTFADGSKMFLEGRNIDGCNQEFASYAHGTKGSAVISSNSHSPARSRIYKGQNMIRRSDITWAFPQPEPNPYQVEWDDLIHAIRKDKLYNEVKRGAEASLVTSMGRMAAHTGQLVTFEDMLNCKCEFAPEVDKLTMTSPAPLQVDKLTKRYPAPQPGIVTGPRIPRLRKSPWKAATLSLVNRRRSHARADLLDGPVPRLYRCRYVRREFRGRAGGLSRGAQASQRPAVFQLC